MALIYTVLPLYIDVGFYFNNILVAPGIFCFITIFYIIIVLALEEISFALLYLSRV